MSSARRYGETMPAGEMLLLAGSVASLLISCILSSSHKQVWMDEIFTWKEVSDRSLWHLYYAIQHGADGGQPLFYATAWLWAKVFGAGVLSLRLYSSAAICGALIVVWVMLRRFYGLWATAFGVLAFWGTSGLLLDQNVEARFYGLYLLAVAVTCDLYTRLASRAEPSKLLLLLTFLSQAALVWTHVLGLIYSGLILMALMIVDAARHRLRFRLYFVYAAGWLALLLWIPAIQSSMAAGKPHGWIGMPTLTDLRTAYLFADSLQWLKFFKRHSMEAGFQIVSRTAEFVIYVPLAIVFLLCLRRIAKTGWRTVSEPRGTLLLLAYLLLFAPVVLFILSHVVTPVFVARYFLPSGIGLAMVLTASADALGSDRMGQFVWPAVVVFLASSPILVVLAVGAPSNYRGYLDVPRLEQAAAGDLPVVAGWQEDFSKLMRLSQNPRRYYFLLDWPAALVGPRTFVLDYHLMHAYRDSGYYDRNIQDSHEFLCAHTDFLVLDAPNASTLDRGSSRTTEMDKPSWFATTIRSNSTFDWRVIDSLDATEVARKLILVHRSGQLDFCQQP